MFLSFQPKPNCHRPDSEELLLLSAQLGTDLDKVARCMERITYSFLFWCNFLEFLQLEKISLDIADYEKNHCASCFVVEDLKKPLSLLIE